MENYAAPFIDLIDREPALLSQGDTESLEYYYASVNLSEGLPVDSDPRRWCAMAHDVGRIAHMLGHLPVASDPGATPQILAWIDEQRMAPLNSYQRARLNSFPGGGALFA